MGKLRFYTIRYSYLNYLCNRDSNIKTKNDRPYLGVVLTINDIDYFAPLCSPKDKMRQWTNKKSDVYLIDGGNFGFIDFSNMIPVHSFNVFQTDIQRLSDRKYARLLNKQYALINKNKDTIYRRAKHVYNLRKKNTPGFKHCLDFSNLEKYYFAWNPVKK